ncbi:MULTISPECIES: DNA-formamidopyrimidine glycosylase family protein [unclassified Streptomyces]|uniref:Fpg/Nei family DNA glycosylase n=1 Tax=unclassified Streptomyces TaxID=2593676 RepID=UPI002DD8934F|nr:MULTISPECIES: DNA-formamidopyrimidine glycosylase family protein [unclassified Streptomyces]WSA94759.1 Fpg/Nei family DNA glycosylase [Streptomyces sp. NBC_01795]WSB79179.1 Fpg/Nei family DNA glycosylase [Streptomyces sp. NBC_01775]WSS41405.1 Fpg/Nei family DNA glycosylase [Streptomyces sp. NBC_01187]
MPEGHTIHRLARDCADRLAGHPLDAASPQGKFTDGAALLDGAELTATEAHGKHLFLGFGPLGWVHVHLGLYGTFRFGAGTPPPPVGQVRLRLATRSDGLPEEALHYADLRGPTRCELLAEPEKQAIDDRLGPDPLRPASDPEAAWARVSRSRTSVAALLMDQKIVSGVGNVYRAEVLFRHGIDPYRPGRELQRSEWDAIWSDLVALMNEGVRRNRIDTVREEHTPEAMGRPPRVDDHGGEVYVYRRAGQPCLICGSPVSSAELAARNLFWCAGCQRR